MDERLQLRLFMHGGVVLLMGLVAGIPYGTAITQGNAEGARAWHVAHTGGVDTALMILVLGVILPRLALGHGTTTTFFWSVLLSGYPFTIAAVLAAVAGVRGLAPTGPAANFEVWFGFTLSGVASLVAGALLVYGALVALRKR